MFLAFLKGFYFVFGGLYQRPSSNCPLFLRAVLFWLVQTFVFDCLFLVSQFLLFALSLFVVVPPSCFVNNQNILYIHFSCKLVALSI